MRAAQKFVSAQNMPATPPQAPPNGLDEEIMFQNPDSSQEGLEKHGWKGYRAVLISSAIILCQFVQMIPYGAGISGATNMAKELGTAPENAVWIVGSYPMTQGTFVLIGGRVGAIYGHKNAVVAAGVIWVIFHLISGFMRNVIALSIMRALSGIGGAFIVPNAIALLTITFPPGKMRNISIGVFGAMAPIGAAGGSVFSGFFGQLAPWWWLFFFLAILGTLVFTLFFFVVPSEAQPMDPNGTFDYIGAYLGVAGLVLFNFVWTEASVGGWNKPFVYILLIVSVVHFALFTIWESRFAKEPVLPLTIWASPSFAAMAISAFLTFMGVGIAIWYITAWNINIRGYTIFSSAAAYVPLAVCGAVAAILSAKAISYIAAEYIMAIGSLASCVALILIATMPEQQTYWAQVFPALILVAFGPDFLFTAAQIIASVTVKREQQGIAGSLIGTLLSYGLATGLGFAGTVEFYTNDGEYQKTAERDGMTMLKLLQKRQSEGKVIEFAFIAQFVD
ncbi:hypothetical protein G7Z17_g1461 [Cylindrodendrum hubeiense]|uniref:Major facilitator superfamily (MFS) profile domain-containing protein n=1 Tax=Cylindrodendrum hubeiense TaxID=595255 RepID=A0A9P5HQ92_9HYPO|nr:hypothetical protein G7Z17_g1461 [Cylindrodendrum hubeiense]